MTIPELQERLGKHGCLDLRIGFIDRRFVAVTERWAVDSNGRVSCKIFQGFGASWLEAVLEVLRQVEEEAAATVRASE